MAKATKTTAKGKPTKTLEPEVVRLRGAHQNNLKHVDLDLPLGVLNVITGPSGSGKSSLAFDTIYAEGQRRYVETFSPYTRQFFDRMDKPKADAIDGIPPAIAIEQTNSVKSTRSTVGTITEINEYLKLLMPRLARAFSPESGREIRPETTQSVMQTLFEERQGQRMLITFPIVVPAGRKPAEFFEFLQGQGYLRVWLEGETVRVDEPTRRKRLPGQVLVIQDRIAITEENRSRLSEALEAAFRFGKGKLVAIAPDDGGAEHRFSRGWHDPHDDIDIRPPSPPLFSFNNPLGACPNCNGFGRVIGLDIHKVIPDRTKTIREGVIRAFTGSTYKESQRDLIRAAERNNVDVDTPFEDLPEADQDWVLEGEVDIDGDEAWEQGLWYGVYGFFHWLESNTYKMHVRVFLSRFRGYHLCPDCHGGRFQPDALNYRLCPGLNGSRELAQLSQIESYTLPDLFQLPVDRLLDVVQRLEAPAGDHTTELLLDEVRSRLSYLREVGLAYLNLDRSTRTLSGGELARVNLTTCLGASLVNALFVLDEPSIGMHARDVGRLIRVLKRLRDNGNTLLVVEHEEAVIRAADNLIDVGPGRGVHGGEIIFTGPRDELEALEEEESLTADYLSGRQSIPVPPTRRSGHGSLTIREASENNLKGLTVEIPLGTLTCITGVSGSGKSTLIHQVLYRHLAPQLGLEVEEEPGTCDGVTFDAPISELVLVDQAQLARTPRSAPALYIGVFDAIRDLFAALPDAAAAGFTRGAFSFNSGPGRCPRCQGNGYEKVEMQFLSDVFVTCPECEGRRYQAELLQIQIAGQSIADILEQTVDEAVSFFREEVEGAGTIADKLELLQSVGLGYLRLGQPLNTLSGGESQRLKLVGHLAGRVGKGKGNADGQPLLIFDEPTTGLHFDDVALLLRTFQRMVETGCSLIVIEHNLEVIKCADYLVDLGPEGGEGGGELIAAGTPEEVAAVEGSHTGRYLKEILQRSWAQRGHQIQSGRQARATAGERIAARGPARRAKAQTSPPLYEESAVPALRVAEEEDPLPEKALAERPPHPEIQIHGARQHNLKNINLSIPRNEIVILTGLSGSGKSTLAFDILFAEGQRRFLDSMSPYARQFVDQLERPDVDLVKGLPPTVAIEQRIARGGVKSTVATVTEVYHFLRLLFSKAGTQYCPDHPDTPVVKQSSAAIAKRVRELVKGGGRVLVLAPLVRARKGYHTEVAAWAGKRGYQQLLVDGQLQQIKGFQRLERFREHTIDVVVGEVREANRADARRIVDEALGIGKGVARLLDPKNILQVVSTEMSCPECHRSFDELDPRLFSFNSPHGWCPECRGMGVVWSRPKRDDQESNESQLEVEMRSERSLAGADATEVSICPGCEGKRLNEVALNVRLQGWGIDDFTGVSARRCLEMLHGLKFSGRDEAIAKDIIPEIDQRLSFLESVGLDYLHLSRGATTLSGGESQRIRLAAQLGSNLRGVLYVLDEPTIGLHPRDNRRLLETLTRLRDKGNSLLIVEHDEDTMKRADWVIDLGPGAGREGGVVTAQGPLLEIMQNPDSRTAFCLTHPLDHPVNGSRRPTSGKDLAWIEVTGGQANNLHRVDFKLPIGRLVGITGISGAGKSSLMRGVLLPAVKDALTTTKKPKKSAAASRPKRRQVEQQETLADLQARQTWDSITGTEFLETVYEVDQSPIGKTSRSTPATYLKIFDDIRALFSQVPLARMRGYDASRFSFNTEGGRCETCRGNGMLKLEMNFLPSTWVDCPDCHGKRYNDATLEVEFDGRTIGDVMLMTIAEAAEFFAAHPKLQRTLQLLVDTGLGYLQLGQPSPTLSGGEAQRIKLVSQLAKGAHRAANARLRQNRQPKSTLYLLEEPTIGLHMDDVRKLIDVLHRLVDDGHTVVVIEHNLDVIAECDYLIDVGPEAGERGGKIVARGKPEQVAKSKTSQTAPFLREKLGLSE